MEKFKNICMTTLKYFLYLCSIACILYPLVNKYLAYKSQTEVISNFDETIAKTDAKELEEKQKEAEEFNKQIASTAEVVDGSEDETNTYDFLQTGEIIGHIEIEKINVSLPIYETVTEENLIKGVAHIEGTSLPTGGANTHSVLAGHTGISQAEIFDRLDELEIGDELSITFLEKTTKYKVIDKNIVLPNETSSLKIEDGRCLVTLVTCTPKTVNTHRLLVTAEKIEEAETEPKTDVENTNVEEDITNDVGDTKITETNEESGNNVINAFVNFVKKNKITLIIILCGVLLLIFVEITKKILTKKNNTKK